MAKLLLRTSFAHCGTLTVLLAGLLAGCEGGTVTKAKPVPAQRNGRSVISVSKQFVDALPSISADGGRIVFISGRTGTDRAFRSEYASGQTVAAPARVTADDGLTKETFATISPDGAWVALTAVKDGNADVYLADFAGTSYKAVTADSNGEYAVAFSPDSKLIAFISSTAAGTAGRLTIASIGDGSTFQTQALGSDDQTFTGFLWGSGQYTLFGIYRDKTSGKQALAEFKFADVAAAASATSTVLFSDFPATARSVVSSQSIFYAQRSSTSGRTVGETGTAPQSGPLYAVINEAATRSLTTDSTATAWTSLPTVDAHPLGVSNDGADVFSLTRKVIRCAAEEASSYITVLMIAATDGSNPADIIIRANPSGVYDLGSDPCARTFTDGTAATIDFTITDARFSAQSTRATYRAAAVSLATGDPEIILIEKAADGTTNRVAISQNPKS